MPKDYSRTQRIADQIQRELAVLIETEVKDPRVGRITITGVEVTRDYSHAKIYYTTLSNKEDKVAIEEGLQHASGFLRSQLSSRIRLRVIPQLHFIYDESVERGLYLSQLIDKATGKI
ncbi:30S ribosome-binding factor RbfA [Nitrosomonas sp. Nm34]|uniref:30S ribosome-binding factor RbfA n=1 Tax=Nitrosomonas sp. Nm34 TaxID=1881055 RepID=UPI0008E97D86|nr:30S ribosome-binding factor RbfA [Nitrosomonas sp. Nm34]SFI72604.1 ribosome-binding factor A [Nitrosomonas sp. Nm34]